MSSLVFPLAGDVSLGNSSEEINKRLKSKAEESGIKSEEEGEIDEPDDDSDHDKSRKNSTRKSSQFDNDIYAEDDDDDEHRSSTDRRKQINASKQKETEHSKSLQLLVEGRKKKQGKPRSMSANRKSSNAACVSLS